MRCYFIDVLVLLLRCAPVLSSLPEQVHHILRYVVQKVIAVRMESTVLGIGSFIYFILDPALSNVENAAIKILSIRHNHTWTLQSVGKEPS